MHPLHIGYSPGEHRSFTSADNSQTSLAKTPARCWDWSPVSPLCLLPCPFSPGSHSSRVSKRWAVGRWRPEHTSSLIQEYCGALWAEMRSHFLGVLACWVERICPSLLSLSSREVYFETFYPFPRWGDGGFSDGGKGEWMARGASVPCALGLLS